MSGGTARSPNRIPPPSGKDGQLRRPCEPASRGAPDHREQPPDERHEQKEPPGRRGRRRGRGAVVGPAAGGAATTVRGNDAAHASPSCAYIQDPRSGELRLMVGEREVVVHDRDLVTRILNAAGGE